MSYIHVQNIHHTRDLAQPLGSKNQRYLGIGIKPVQGGGDWLTTGMTCGCKIKQPRAKLYQKREETRRNEKKGIMRINEKNRRTRKNGKKKNDIFMIFH